MHPVPKLPRLAAVASELLDGGHVWLSELVEGGWLRFQLEPSGLVRFGTASTVYDDPTSVPPAYRYAVDTINRHLERDALRTAVDDVTEVTFCGIATYRETLDYDWHRLPGFLGTHVSVGDANRPPDEVVQIFSALGLEPARVIDRERHVRDLAVNAWTPPTSAWRDGPAAGILVTRKGGGSAIWRPSSPPKPVPKPTVDFVGGELIDRFESAVSDRDGIDVTTLTDLVMAAGVRERPDLRSMSDEQRAELRSTINERAQQYLASIQ